MIELENHAEPPVSQGIAAGGGQVVDPPALEVDLPLVGGVEGAQQVQQGALARAALADDRQEFARPGFACSGRGAPARRPGPCGTFLRSTATICASPSTAPGGNASAAGAARLTGRPAAAFRGTTPVRPAAWGRGGDSSLWTPSAALFIA